MIGPSRLSLSMIHGKATASPRFTHLLPSRSSIRWQAVDAGRGHVVAHLKVRRLARVISTP
jgi:hypothetical protein